MKRKSILMPHVCHKTGWWLLVLLPLAWGFYEILFRFFHESKLFALVNDNSRLLTMTCYLVVIASAFLICLSREKVEDEMVSKYRLKAIGISAYVHFVLYLAFWLFYALQHGFRWGIGKPWEMGFFVSMQLFTALSPFTMAGLYYLVFKGMLWHSRK